MNCKWINFHYKYVSCTINAVAIFNPILSHFWLIFVTFKCNQWIPRIRKWRERGMDVDNLLKYHSFIPIWIRRFGSRPFDLDPLSPPSSFSLFWQPLLWSRDFVYQRSLRPGANFEKKILWTSLDRMSLKVEIITLILTFRQKIFWGRWIHCNYPFLSVFSFTGPNFRLKIRISEF